MSGNIALDVFIGLVFIYLLYSLLATIIQEMIATKLAFRSKILEKAILRMLEDGMSTSKMGLWGRFKSFANLFGKPNLLKDKSITPWFYVHPLIKYLGEDNFYSKPAYISAQNFSKVVVDLLKGFGQVNTNDVQTINNSINNGTIFKIPINISSDIGNPAVKAIIQQGNAGLINALDTVQINTDTALFLRSLWLESGADLEKFRSKLEDWFNDTMERCSGWYKRYTRLVLFIVGFVIAVAFNVDTIAINRILSKDDGARDQLVQMAISKQQQYGEIIKNFDNQKNTTKDTIQTNALKAADSSYKQAYELLSNDANAANTILGLGRPWSDSLKMCKDSINRNLKIKNLKCSIDSIDKITSELALMLTNNKRDTIGLLRKKKPIDSIRIDNDTANISALKIRIANTNSASLKEEYNRLVFTNERCAYIQAYIGDRWFVYAPNQNGNCETFFGWLITAFALCLGAPFWFDLLNKLISLRGAGTKISSSTNDNSGGTSTSSGNSNIPAPIIINSNQTEEAVG
ncbi:hypothetical protein [Limnovirga soli]|uniref:Uncharacterized protein n=1 Tax=Limnovirga soli TaxID=2656915 RepID=A0A8J8FGB7_9BACT|nr:hypothetical protein [Limnovirga soli]NNV56152.1 hypothetical protein [Limnovirga soli]